MDSILSNPLFGIFLTIVTYLAGVKISKKVRSPLANPLLIAIILSIIIMKTLGISYSDYMNGGEFIAMLIGPSTAVLGLSIFRQKQILKEQFVPIVSGCFVGSIVSMVSVVWLCQLFSIRMDLLQSLLPKSVTTAIAIDLSEQLGGISSVTMLAVVVCGILGSVINPLIIKALHITDPVAIGVGMGTASHGVGTSKALEMGAVEGAVSGVSIGVTGIITVLIALFL